ncbi:MAG TPA: nucleotide exchange factor GrpE [Caulobacteraceae bacterium]|nr:nucleotide exchange factor GrpE [Caulobacteraceae bacterium]
MPEDGQFPDEAEDAAQEAELLRAEIAALKDQALRYAAEAENTKRRAEKEINDARAYAIQKFSRDLLDAADSLGRALQAAHSTNMASHVEPAVKNMVLGIDMTEKALQTAFERNGLKKVDPARGEKFDPHRHQAVMEQPADDAPPGAVVAVMQPGYELFGRIVRPAMVAVTPAKSAAPPAEPTGGTYSQSDGAGPRIDTKA